MNLTKSARWGVVLMLILCPAGWLAAASHSTISGYTLTAAGTAVPGVNVSADNGGAAVITAADGSYTVTVPNNWSGTVSVSKTGWLLTPPSRTYSGVRQNQANQNYIGYQPKVSGQVKNADGLPITGANVSAGTLNAITNSSGLYEITIPYGWIGSIIVSKNGFNFDPFAVSNITSDLQHDFIGFQPTVSGQVTTTTGPLAGAIVTAQGFDPVLTDSQGNYRITLPYNWSGTLTISKPGYYFDLLQITNLTADRTQNFTGFQPKISGKITSPYGGFQSANITAQGIGSVLTDRSGNYELVIPYGWSGTITASYTGLTFDPPSYDFTNVQSNQSGKDFAVQVLAIRGRIDDSRGSGVADVNITAANAYNSPANSDAQGNYSLIIPNNWSGTVTVSKTGWYFAAPSRTYPAITQALADQDYTGYQPHISGFVTNFQGQPLQAIIMSADHGGGSAATDTTGRYELPVPYDWTGLLKESTGTFTTSPVNRFYRNVKSDVNNQNFTASKPKISGYILDRDSKGVPGAVLTVSGGITLNTDSKGYYELVVPLHWSGSILASATGYIINANYIHSYTDVTADYANQNFSAWRPKLSGNIKNSQGNYLAGIYVIAVNTGLSAQTTPNGDYVLYVPYNWSGSVQASAPPLTFTPPSASYTNLITDQTLNFTTLAPLITGTVTNSKGENISGALITAEGTSFSAVSSGGTYSLWVPNNFSGTIRVQKDGLYFPQPTYTYTNITTNQYSQNFVAYLPKISGYFRDSWGYSIGDVTYTVSGIGTYTTYNGSYTVYAPYNWSGTITPSKTNWGFNPAQLTFTNLTTDQTYQNCTAFQPTISGYIKNPDGSTVTTSVTVTLSTSSSTTTSYGYYSFTIPYGWSGTITASASGIGFSDSPKIFTNVNQNMTNVNFTTIRPIISGTVRTRFGQPFAGATIAASGMSSKTTDASGNYSFTVNYNWSGSVSVSTSGYIYTPSSRSYSLIKTDMTAQDFNSFQPIASGYVKDINDRPLPAAPMTITNYTGPAVITDSNGFYSVMLPAYWSGSITPNIPGATFYPQTKIYSSLTTDQAQIFKQVINPVISGCITDSNNSPTANIPLTVTGGLSSPVTDSNGNYRITVPYYWSGTITPSKSGYVFTPPSRTYQNLTVNQVSQNFSYNLPRITGRITLFIDPNKPVAGAQIDATGIGQFVTDANGSFSFLVPIGWTGTITPSKAPLVFTPATLTNVTTDQSITFSPLIPYAGGTGTSADPYQVSRPEHLVWLSKQYQTWTSYFMLTSDIDMSEPNAAGFAPIGTSSQNFRGSFEGAGHTVCNLTITKPFSYTGLFGYVYGQSSSSIKNLTLLNTVINTTSSNVGALAGYMNYVTVENCHARNAHIAGTNYVGGLIGAFYASSQGTAPRLITKCSAEGSVTGANLYIGGLFGIVNAGVSQCYVNADVNGFSNVGGFSGTLQGSAQDCYSSGTVNGSTTCGGFAGASGDSRAYPAMLTNCYSSAAVSGQAAVGGFIGSSSPLPLGSECYWDIQASSQSASSGGIGKTTAEMQSIDTFVAWGCSNTWTIQPNDYPRLAWQNLPGQFIPEPVYGGGSGDPNNPYLIYTAQQLCRLSGTYCHMDKSFKLMADIDMSQLEPDAFKPIGSTGFCGTFDGNGYAILNLKYNAPAVQYAGLFARLGSSASDSKYVTLTGATVKNLTLINPAITAGSYTGALCGTALISSIDNCYVIDCNVSGTGYVGSVAGVLQSCILTNTSSRGTVRGAGYVGGIAGQASTYTDQQCNIAGCEFEGFVFSSGNYSGGLVGYISSGLITDCSARADVNGTTYTGGLTGYNNSSTSRCCSRSKVTGTSPVGGFAGRCGGTVTDCFAKCNVTGTSHVAGFIGYITYAKPVINCYSDSTVHSTTPASTAAFAGYYYTSYSPNDFISCFYNKDYDPNLPALIGMTDPNLIGLTSAQMRSRSVFTDARWDFAGETQNGTADTWTICEGSNTPRLTAQVLLSDLICPDGVSLADFSVLAQYWLTSGCDSNQDCLGSDLDRSGAVNFEDLYMLMEQWLMGTE